MAAFTVLHVCMGNICRSPMAERLLVLAAGHRLAKIDPDADLDALLQSVSAGTGGWHEGEEMNPPAARQVLARGGSVDGFAARKLTSAQVTAADLVLTATADQSDYLHALVPGSEAKTFVLGHLARLLPEITAAELPPYAADPEAFAARARAVVAAADRHRAGAEPANTDDLDDPWGRGDQTFQRIADTIDDALYALVDVLFGAVRTAPS